MIQNPKTPAIWGIRNLSQETWTATALDDTTKQIANNEVLVIPKTKSIDFFGNSKATIANPD